MWKAIVWKELRENWWLAGLGLAAHLHMVAVYSGLQLLPTVRTTRFWSMPFVNHGFLASFVSVSLLLAVALGLRQTLSESVRGTWLFLLHRPLDRRTLIGLKLGVGAVLYLGCAATPIVVYACWAATPGTHPSPFYWSMTLDAWLAWGSLVAMYLAAFLSGLRPARWFGSRLFPLAGTGMLLLFQNLILPWYSLRVGLDVALALVLLASIFYVAATRDFS